MPRPDPFTQIDRLFQAAAEAALTRAPRRLATFTALATAATVHAQTTVYVDDDAPPGGDGYQWSTAYRDLQEALGFARRHAGGSPVIIKIAEGIYAPDQRTRDRRSTFAAVSGVTLEGGYAGLGAADPNARDFAAFATVLTGDLARDDGPAFVNRSDNSFHVVTMSAAIMNLDGLTIRGGHADEPAWGDQGSGVRWETSYGAYQDGLSITDCVITDNFSSDAGAALWNSSGRSTTALRCRFVGNRGGPRGGAVVGTVFAVDTEFLHNQAPGGPGGAVRGDLHAVRCRFVANTASGGGAVHGVCVLSACTFLDNSASAAGGAVFAENYTSLVDHCLFAGNHADTGGALAATDGELSVQRSTLVNNDALRGGAISVAGWYPRCTLIDSVLWANTATLGSQIDVGGRGTLTIGRSNVQGGLPGISVAPLAGLYQWFEPILDADPQFVDPVGPDGDPSRVADNDYRLRAVSPCVDAGPCIAASRWRADDVDHAGEPRYGPRPCLVYACADLGAFEFQSEPCIDTSPAIFVRSDAGSLGDGRSWATAYRSVQQAIDSLRDRPIWLAGGTYHPASSLLGRPPRDIPAVRRTLIGGFAGVESSADERVIGAHTTIISADRLGNDDGTPAGWSDNLASFLDAGALRMTLEDITFRAARGDPPVGAALVMFDVERFSRVRVEDCALANFHLAYLDGSMFQAREFSIANCVAAGTILRINADSLDLEDCSFESNRGAAIISSSRGWAYWRNCRFSMNVGSRACLELTGEHAFMEACDFEANLRSSDVALGGALVVGPRGATIDRSRFLANAARATLPNQEAAGGAIWSSGPLHISNSLLVGNSAVANGPAGGAAIYSSGNSTTIVASTIAQNRASSMSEQCTGAVHLDRVRGLVASSILWQNERSDGETGQLAQLDVRQPTDGTTMLLRRSIVDGFVTLPNASEIRSQDPLFVDPIGPDHLPTSGDEDFRLRRSSIAIDRADGRLAPLGDLTEDVADADNDGVWAEPTPFDLAGAPRLLRAAGTPVTSSLILDFGAFEFQQTLCAADWNGQDGLSLQDLFDFLTDYFRNQADFNRSGATDIGDIFDFLATYFAGCS